MFENDEADEAEDDHPDPEGGPSIRNDVSTSASRTPGRSTNTNSCDELAMLRSQQTLSTSSHSMQRRSNFASTSAARAASASPQQPRVTLNMDIIQQQAELLELQTRRYMDETQRQADQHFEEMLETKAYRVTHACEHCRQRKAKCSGQRPCQRCAKQSILCVYSKHDQKGKQPKALQTFKYPPSQSTSRHPLQMQAPPAASFGPMRNEQRRGGRHAGISAPYEHQKNTVPCMTQGCIPATREDHPLPPCPPIPSPLPSSSGFLPPLTAVGSVQLLPPTAHDSREAEQCHAGQDNPSMPSPWPLPRPTPLDYRTDYASEERRGPIILEASGDLAYGSDPRVSTLLPESSQASRPWNTQPTFGPNPEARLPSGLPLRYSSVPARMLLQEPSGALPRSPLSSSAASNAWSRETQTSRTMASASRPERDVQCALAFHYQQHTVGLGVQYGGRHSSWSTEGGWSRDIRHGSLSTEGGPSPTSEPATLEHNVQPPCYLAPQPRPSPYPAVAGALERPTLQDQQRVPAPPPPSPPLPPPPLPPPHTANPHWTPPDPRSFPP